MNSVESNPVVEEAQILRWFSEDPCFQAVSLRPGLWEEPEGPRKEEVTTLVMTHMGQCGKCIANVLTVAASSNDAAQRHAYNVAYWVYSERLLREKGCEVTEEREPQGRRIRIRWSPAVISDMRLLFKSIETFIPVDSKEAKQSFYDVVCRELFDDPGPLIQQLDGMAAWNAQLYPPVTGLHHWQAIVCDTPEEMHVRWDGRSRKIASDCTLEGRYDRLVRKNIPRDPSVQVDEENRRTDSISRGEVSLKLQEAALAYKGGLRFASYLKTILGYRLIDSLRQGGRDPLGKALSIDERLEGDHPDGTKGVTAGDLLESVQREDSQSEEGKVIALIEIQEFRERFSELREKLSERDQKILDLRHLGLTDSEIGSRLGIRRETVNRHLAQIKELATSTPHKS